MWLRVQFNRDGSSIKSADWVDIELASTNSVCYIEASTKPEGLSKAWAWRKARKAHSDAKAYGHAKKLNLCIRCKKKKPETGSTCNVCRAARRTYSVGSGRPLVSPKKGVPSPLLGVSSIQRALIRVRDRCQACVTVLQCLDILDEEISKYEPFLGPANFCADSHQTP